MGLASDNVEKAGTFCLTFAFLAGFFQGFLGCLLAWIAKQKNEAASRRVDEEVGDDGARKPPEPTWLDRLNVAGVILSATVPGVLSIAALAFGAISMVVVVRSSSILVFNVLFTRAFGLGTVKQNDGVGTALCVLGIVALFKTAPTDRSVTDEDFLFLLSRPISVVWMSVLGAACVLSLGGAFLLHRDAAGGSAHRQLSRRQLAAHNHRRGKLLAGLVSLGVAASSAWMDLSAKGYTGAIANTRDDVFWSSGIFWLSLLVFIASAIVMRGSYVYGCKACDLLVFIPLNTMLIIFISAATGFFVMEEWRTVESWDVFCASYLVIFLGINLLVSKEARDRVSSDTASASATLLEVQQLCTDMYTAQEKVVAVDKFEQLIHKAIQLGEVESSELIALIVALLNEHPELPTTLIGDWLQLAYPTIFNYVQDTSSTPGPQRHARNLRGRASTAAGTRTPRRMNRFKPTIPARFHGYRAMLDDMLTSAGVAGGSSATGVSLEAIELGVATSDRGGLLSGTSGPGHDGEASGEASPTGPARRACRAVSKGDGESGTSHVWRECSSASGSGRASTGSTNGSGHCCTAASSRGHQLGNHASTACSRGHSTPNSAVHMNGTPPRSPLALAPHSPPRSPSAPPDLLSSGCGGVTTPVAMSPVASVPTPRTMESPFALGGHSPQAQSQ
mmetsp:Transcript_5067/g.13916  ORF Transcript_5067/g.13916 Transcript_5067/m.13916 type:complete len:676 (+) Transcript_5067:156-2183(+)